ncbi:MAG TPA: hypothetical protein VGZ47_14575, partial [Gemmataceae bacterium]|nr:hypothetical protein [Gemmataceae bacterium]
ACRSAWRVVDQGANGEAVWLTAVFQPSIDAPEFVRFWPADYRIGITFRLEALRLHLVAKIENPDQRLLPFGLGYHPYLRTDIGKCTVQVPARKTWQLDNSLPTGRLQPVDARTDLRTPRRFDELQLDDIYSDLDESNMRPELGILRGEVKHMDHGTLRLWTSPEFTEMVCFTPPHRKAICLEPYTCVTDAINLEQKGFDTGWRILRPGHSFTATVVLEFAPL